MDSGSSPAVFVRRYTFIYTGMWFVCVCVYIYTRESGLCVCAYVVCMWGGTRHEEDSQRGSR